MNFLDKHNLMDKALNGFLSNKLSLMSFLMLLTL